MNLKNKDKFYIILLAIVIIVSLWAYISTAFITRNFKRDMAANRLANRKVTVKDLLLTETKEGKKYWEIFAEKGYYEDDKKLAIIMDSIGNFYDESGEVVASFKSPRAIINTETKEIIMYDRSILMYKDYTSIIADEFNYNGNNQPITAKGSVIIQKPLEALIKSDEAILSDEMTKITVKGKVKTKIYEKGKLK